MTSANRTKVRLAQALAAAWMVAVGSWTGIATAQPEPLTPRVTPYPPSGQAPLTVVFDGGETTGKWGSAQNIDSWEWDFDYDGATFEPEGSLLRSAVVTATYDRPGSYVCRLRVTDEPNTGGPREAFLEVPVEVVASTSDPAVRSEFPPGAWGAGINPIWASPDQEAVVAAYLAPTDQIFMLWEHVEPNQHGVYDWGRLDNGLAEAAANDHVASVQINSNLPDWVFDHIAQTGESRGEPSPQFWDPDYIAYYDQLIEELGAHIAASPHRDRVVYVRQQWNALHTESADFGTPEGTAMPTWVGNPAWQWPSDDHEYRVEWTPAIGVDYERRIINKFLDTFSPLGIGVTLRALGSHLPQSEWHAFYTEGDGTAWVLQTNNTFVKWDSGEAHTREFMTMRAFGARGFEETWGLSDSRIAQRNPELSVEQDMYGVVLRGLEVGLPYIGIKGGELILLPDHPAFGEIFNFGNRHAGWHRFPRSAPGAWLVLGSFEPTTTWKLLNTLTRDNWGWFLRQNDPAGTTTALTLVGNPSSPYGLTARQLDATTSFDLDDGFVEASAVEQLDVVEIYQPGTGSLELRADDGGSMATVTESSHEDALGWRTATYRVAAPTFADGPDGKTDLELVPTDGAPVVHRIEVLRTGDPSQGGGAGSGGSGGSGGSNPGTGGSGGSGTGGGAGAGAVGAGASDDEGGCGCAVLGASAPGTVHLVWLGLALFLIPRRRHCRSQ